MGRSWLAAAVGKRDVRSQTADVRKRRPLCEHGDLHSGAARPRAIVFRTERLTRRVFARELLAIARVTAGVTLIKLDGRSNALSGADTPASGQDQALQRRTRNRENKQDGRETDH